MFRRAVVYLLAAAMAVSIMGCGCGTTNENDTTVENTPPETTFEAEDTTQGAEELSTEENTEDNVQQAGDEAGNTAAGTIGTILLEDFHTRKAEAPQMTAQEMADNILTNSIIQFQGSTMPVEEGLLTGFGNAEITGFKEGVMFAPMIGSIPFVGYVFSLNEDTDAAAFVQTLKDNADPRWNICTEAEETVVENVDDMVFFLMCPRQFDEPTE